MSIDTIRIVSQRLKPIERKIRQILRIGKVTEVSGSELSISFSEVESIKSVPFLSLNGLQLSPKVGDFVMVFSPEGRLEHSIAVAIVGMGKSGGGVTLKSDEQSLGDVLSALSQAILKISSPGFFTAAGTPVTGSPISVSTKGFS